MNIKTFILAFLLIGSLGVNLVLFIGGSLFSVLNSGFETITGIQTVASRNKAEIAGLGEEVIIERNAKREVKGQLTQTTTELANAKITNSKLDTKTKELTADLVAERKIKRQVLTQLADVSADLTTLKSTSAKLKKEMQRATSQAIADRKVAQELKNTLANKTAELSASKLANKQLQTQVRDLTTGLVPFKGKKVALKTAVNETADSIGKRAVKTAKREVASMPGEAIPYLGTAIIVGATALEISDLCLTLKDMTALKKAFDPDLSDSNDELEVCSIKIPPKEEILAAVKASPQKAWKAAKDASPSWEEIKDIDIPDVTFTELWDATKNGSLGLWENTSGGVSELSKKAKKWWNDGQ